MPVIDMIHQLVSGVKAVGPVLQERELGNLFIS